MSNVTEVPKWMKGFEVIFGEDAEQETASEFQKVMKSASTKNFVEGEIFEGTVVDVNDEHVILDIGYKQEGLVLTQASRLPSVPITVPPPVLSAKILASSAPKKVCQKAR